MVVVDVNVVEDDVDEEGDDIFFLVTFVNEGDENDMSAQAGNSTPLNGGNMLRERN